MRLYILCEDDLQKRLIERLAERWGVDRRRRFIDAAPKGRNGSQYVLDHYVDVVRQWRRASHDQHVYLVVMIDGDELGVAARRLQLERLLRVAEVDPIDPARSAILVPTRHIETWIAWLCGHRPIDEVTRYKVQDTGSDVARKIKSEEYSPRRAVESWTPAHMDEPTVVPSLDDARREITRLDFEG